MSYVNRWILAATLASTAACFKIALPSASAASSLLAEPDLQFIKAAAVSDAFQVQAGRLALSKANDDRVKSYATNMIAACSQTTQQLKQIAQSKDITLDTALTPVAEKVMVQLNSASPRFFDDDYVRDQVLTHQIAENAFQDEVSNGQDPDLKRFAAATLPEIRLHGREASALKEVR